MNLNPLSKTPVPVEDPAAKQAAIKARLDAYAEKITTQHSMFWMGSNVEELTEKLKAGSIEYVDRLRKIQQAVGNFVKIVTEKDIPVVFSGGQQSYTNGKAVVLSADTDPAGLDSLVGTALHEGAHCLLSNQSLAFLPEMELYFEKMIIPTKIPYLADKLGLSIMPAAILSKKSNTAAKPLKVDPNKSTAAPKSESSVYELVQMVMNVLEDRRIDLWMYQHASGYRPYYEAMYDKYWHSKQIDAAMESEYYRSPAVNNYMLHVINMTNKHFDPNAMPLLGEIKKQAKLYRDGLFARGDEDPNWRTWRSHVGNSLEKMPKLWADSVKIVEMILEHSTSVENQTPPPPQPNEGDEGEGDPGDLPNLDGGIPSQEQIDKAMEKLKKFLNGELDKTALDAESADMLEQMNATQAKVKDVSGDFIAKNVKARVIIYRDITKQIASSNKFPMSYTRGYCYGKNRDGEIAVKKGIQMGQILANRIRVIQDERPLTFTRQQSGRLDKRLIAGLGFGYEQVFSHMISEKKAPVDVWLDIDVSGSMAGEKFSNAMAVAVAISYAASKTRTLNCTVAIRDSGQDIAQIAILYESKKHRIQRLLEIVPLIGCNGGTPEGLCFEAVKDEILAKSRGTRKFFINLSDGEPCHGFIYKDRHYSYGGAQAAEHTRNMMREMRAAGIEVLSYYVEDDYYAGQEHANFKRMYGESARFINPTQVNEIVQTVNKMLMGE